MMARRGRLLLKERFSQFRPCPVRLGFVALWTLLILVLLLAGLAVAVNSFWLAEAEQELHNAADAAALAGIQELVNDDWLRNDPTLIPLLLERCWVRAQEYASLNRTLTRPVELLANAANDPNGDIVLGHSDATTGLQIPADILTNPASLTLDQVTTIAVQARRFRSRGNGVPVLLGPLVLLPAIDLQANAWALLDTDVIGFRPRLDWAVPLVPLGVRSDPTQADPHSWEHQILNRQGQDQYTFVPGQGVSLGTDGIPEIDMVLELEPAGTPANSNAFLLQLGSADTPTALNSGVTAADLQAQEGQLVLDANNQLFLPGRALGPAETTQAFTDLRNGLEALLQSGEVRIWPLVASVDATLGQAMVTGFVGARVVKVDFQTGGPLRFTLQPGMRGVPAALTNALQRNPANLVPNPYLGRVRLVH